jgi:hypothetical protein
MAWIENIEDEIDLVNVGLVAICYYSINFRKVIGRCNLDGIGEACIKYTRTIFYAQLKRYMYTNYSPSCPN